MAKYAPARDDGKFPYVRTHKWFAHTHQTIVWAANAKEAKSHYGWTRELHTTISIRRATPEDMNLQGAGDES